MDAAPLLGPRLSVSGLSKTYGSTQVLKGVNLRVDAGETVAILGKSGVGKSTLLRCLNLLEVPECGELSLDGQVYYDAPNFKYEPWEVRRSITMIFQDFNLFPNMTVLGNIAFALWKTRGLSKLESKERATRMAEALGIGNVLNQFPNSLSGGQAQRCAIARGMVLEPKVFLLDEITSALDPETVLDVLQAMQNLRAIDPTGSMASIMVTHLVDFAIRCADRIVFLHHGQVHEEHRAADFIRCAVRPETKKFLDAFYKA